MAEGDLNIPIAFFAGVISFLSPCVLPIIPSYLSFIGGVSYTELVEKRVSRWGILLKTLFFVLGFSAIFILLGTVFSSIGLALSGISRIINMGAGVIVILFGLHFIFDFWKILNRERRLQFQKKPAGFIGSFLLGMAFGAGWTPCIGPILASILFLAGSSGKVLYGTLLLSIFSLSLGIPFILAGLSFSAFKQYMERVKPYLPTIRIISGIFLVIIGVLIFSGSLIRFNAVLFTAADIVEKWYRNNPVPAKILSGLFFIFLAIALSLPYFRVKLLSRSSTLNQQQSDATRTAVKLHPVRLAFILLSLTVSILSFLGIINIPELLTFWLRFQGI